MEASESMSRLVIHHSLDYLGLQSPFSSYAALFPFEFLLLEIITYF